jgi:hypothetical protein
MGPRFDLFRRQNDNLLKWMGTASTLADVEKLMDGENSGCANLVVRTCQGVREMVTISDKLVCQEV